MQKKQTWNVKTLVFMALLIAMHLVLTRVLVIDLGAYRISVGSVTTILAGLWLGPYSGRSLWIMCRYYRMLYERICCKPIYYSCSHSLGSSSGTGKTTVRKQKENRKNSCYLYFYCDNCNSQFSGINNSRTGNYAWI